MEEPLESKKSEKPKDKKNLVFLFFICLGLSHMLGYNCFVTAYDYFKPNLESVSKNFEFWFNTIFNCTTVLALLFDLMISTIVKKRRKKAGKNQTTKKLRFTSRIIVGFIIYIVSMATPPIIIEYFPPKLAFALILIEVTLVGCSTGIVQGGIFGFASLFEPKYTTALMIGQGVAGALISYLRVITKISTKQTPSGIRTSAISYFETSSAIVLFVIFGYYVLLRAKFTKYYINKYYTSHYKEAHNLEINKEPSSEREEGISSNYDNDEDKYLLHDDSIDNEAVEKEVKILPLLKKTFPYGISVFTVFTITLAIFPSVIVEIPSNSNYLNKTGWFAVILITLFNTGDLIGRSLPEWFPNFLSTKFIICVVFLRLIFCVLFVLCVKKTIFSDAAAIIFMIIFAITNGYPSTVVMMRGPFDKKIEEHERDTVAMILRHSQTNFHDELNNKTKLIKLIAMWF
ncbi:equilibrative nucleoside transporter 1 [Anaeramoeba flamelloides]|uniref:Equilibrative nucleoside transporter 1 n=1 Tax=Anaeramoeba flamelloides TaxID=1746091 RepID=A0ABQ8XZN8_9EUKA|nr:equilibrative nucleoside transporter 1 [Anaeramoeba flamelloides]